MVYPMDIELSFIPGHEGRYSVTRDGRVYSHYRRGKWLKPNVIGGYLYVKLYLTDGTAKLAQISHLILETYVGPRPQGALCLHEDDDPLNNQLSNLKWGTYEENWEQAVVNKRRRWDKRRTKK